MRTKLAVSIMLISLLTGIMASAINIRPARADNVILSITPSLVEKDPPINPPESFFDVFLDISSVVDLFGFEIKVNWTDNTLITLDNDTTNANLNTLLGQIWTGGYFIAKIESTGGGGGGGYYRVAAVSTGGTLSGFTGDHGLMKLHFKIMRNCNFVLQTDITIDPAAKLSDSGYQTIPVATINNGLFRMKLTKPDLEFELVEPDAHLFEYCKIFRIEVYVTHICAGSPLTDYDFNITYNTELLNFTDVYSWGELGTGHCTNDTGVIHIWDDPGGLSKSGDRFLLFTLTFHIEFDDRIEHIWRVGRPQSLTATIAFLNAELSFDQGTITAITMPNARDITVNLIRGDTDCDGKVTVFDLRCVAAYYDLSLPVKYDLTTDGIIDIFDLVVVATNFNYGT
jgi:hypothetical protein